MRLLRSDIQTAFKVDELLMSLRNITSRSLNYRFPKLLSSVIASECKPKKELLFSDTEIS